MSDGNATPDRVAKFTARIQPYGPEVEMTVGEYEDWARIRLAGDWERADAMLISIMDRQVQDG